MSMLDLQGDSFEGMKYLFMGSHVLVCRSWIFSFRPPVFRGLSPSNEVVPMGSSQNQYGQNIQQHQEKKGKKARGGGNPVTIRCHANYKNEGPWYDWVIVNFSIKDDESSFESIGPEDQNPQYEDGCVPCKVFAVAQAPTGEVRLLVHPCMFRNVGI